MECFCGSVVVNRAINQPLPSQLRRREHSLRSESAPLVAFCQARRTRRVRKSEKGRRGCPARSLNAAILEYRSNDMLKGRGDSGEMVSPFFPDRARDDIRLDTSSLCVLFCCSLLPQTPLLELPFRRPSVLPCRFPTRNEI